MVVTQTQICNLALAHIKQTQVTISNLDTDKGRVGTILRLHYDISRQFVLSDHKWNFATSRRSLALISNPVTGNWGYQYWYPNDCINLREIETSISNSPVPFEVENYENDSKCVFTNADKAIGVFTSDITNPRVFSIGFVNALSWYLASEIAPALSEDMQVQESCLTIYKNTLIKSKRMDSNEGESDIAPNAPWDMVRTGGSLV